MVFETVSAFSARSCECFSQVPCSFHRNLYLVSNLEQIVRSHKNIKHLFTVINININTILFYFNTTVSAWSVSLQQRVTNASIFSHYILPDPAHLAAHSESESDDDLFIFRGYFSSFVFFFPSRCPKMFKTKTTIISLSLMYGVFNQAISSINYRQVYNLTTFLFLSVGRMSLHRCFYINTDRKEAFMSCVLCLIFQV